MDHARILHLIHQTAPALVADGDQLTHLFYHHLFGHYPELRHTFNMANQANGAQARSLFDAIVLFVTKFDQLETLGPDAKRIAAKHVSVDVRPEDYAVVGASLLATIQLRLGAEATPDVMKAWELAYGRIAQVLTGLEAATYEQQREQPGGWNLFKPFVVTRVVAESPGVCSFYLVPQDGVPLPPYLPGQYLSLAVEIPGQPYRQIRQYSLSDATDKPYYRITVKRALRTGSHPAALVSNYLHDYVGQGSTVSVHAPAGEFYLVPGAQAPVVLLAGGLGITPFMAMLEQLAYERSARPVLLVYAVRDASQHPFRARLQQLAQRPELQLFHLYQFPSLITESRPDPLHPETTGLLSADHLDYLLNSDWAGAEFYCCGPLAYMRHVHGLLAARGIHNCRFEEFGPTHQVDAPVAVAEEPAPVASPAPVCPYGHQAAQL